MQVPNIEVTGSTINSPYGSYEPAGFGCIGRAWQPRLALAGTYDHRWRDERAPHLPVDFDIAHFQCAPPDQQFDLFRGGEVLRCTHMAAQAQVVYIIPTILVPVRFRFRDADVDVMALLDTVILEPHLRRAVIVWRASIAMRKQPAALREILIGERPPSLRPPGRPHGKPVFAGIAQTLAWLRQRPGGRS